MRETKFSRDLILWAFFTFYMTILIQVILFKFHTPIDITFLWDRFHRNLGDPDQMMNRLQLSNFLPFHSISLELHRFSTHDLINLFGNIIAFIPYGIFYGLFFQKKGLSLLSLLALSLSLSFCFEYLQVILSMGSFDVDDLILNTSGGFIGYCIFYLYYKYGSTKKIPLRSN